MIYCYHHTDLDGMSSAYCVHKYKPSEIEDSAAFYFACDYNDKFDKHSSKDDVFITDISISESTYPMLLETCKTARTVTWIDHHQMSIDTIENHKNELQSIKNLTYFVSNSSCGAALTYAYLDTLHKYYDEFLKIRKTEDNETYQITSTQEKDVITLSACKGDNWLENKVKLPTWLFYVDDFDCWKKQDFKTDYYHYGMQERNISLTIYNPELDQKVFNPLWETEEFKNTEEIISSGEHIYSFLNVIFKEQIPDTFEWEYSGTKFICKNGTIRGVYNFQNLINKYEAAILFKYSGKSGKWSYSVYSSDDSKFDCKEFCSKFGGGGHVHASGFSTKDLIFTDPKLNK